MSRGMCFALDLIFWAFLGGLLVLIYLYITMDTSRIDNCQKDLPRTQECILTAVPKPIGEEL